MIDLLALFDDRALAAAVLAAEPGLNIGHLLAADRDAALLHQPPGLALGGSQAALYQQGQNVDLSLGGEILPAELGAGHVGAVPAAAEQGAVLGNAVLCPSFLEMVYPVSIIQS